MSDLYRLAITATGEVRDAEGNLISAEPIEAEVTITAAEAKALGYHPEGEPA